MGGVSYFCAAKGGKIDVCTECIGVAAAAAAAVIALRACQSRMLLIEMNLGASEGL